MLFFCYHNLHIFPVQKKQPSITMSGETLIWANRSTDLNNHISSRKQHHSTIDQARAFAAELGPDLELALDQLSNKTALVLHAYVLALHQEGHSYDEIEEIRDAMKKYFDDTFRCFGTNWQFLPDQDEASVGDGGMDKDERSGEWIGNPAFDTAFVSLMQELKDQEERSNARPAKRRTAIGYQDITNLMQHLQKSEAIEAEGLARCLFFQAFAATAFTLWLTYVPCHCSFIYIYSTCLIVILTFLFSMLVDLTKS